MELRAHSANRFVYIRICVSASTYHTHTHTHTYTQREMRNTCHWVWTRGVPTFIFLKMYKKHFTHCYRDLFSKTYPELYSIFFSHIFETFWVEYPEFSCFKKNIHQHLYPEFFRLKFEN
jgi:hypothetical protein